MTRYVVGTDATRLRALLNAQAVDKDNNPLPWESEDQNGRRKPGTVGTTSVQDTYVDEVAREVRYNVTGRIQGLMDAARNGRTRLTEPERVEVSDIETRVTEDPEARAR